MIYFQHNITVIFTVIFNITQTETNSFIPIPQAQKQGQNQLWLPITNCMYLNIQLKVVLKACAKHAKNLYK